MCVCIHTMKGLRPRRFQTTIASRLSCAASWEQLHGKPMHLLPCGTEKYAIYRSGADSFIHTTYLQSFTCPAVVVVARIPSSSRWLCRSSTLQGIRQTSPVVLQALVLLCGDDRVVFQSPGPVDPTLLLLEWMLQGLGQTSPVVLLWGQAKKKMGPPK